MTLRSGPQPALFADRASLASVVMGNAKLQFHSWISRRTNVVKRDFDLIVYGATGYTGRLIAEYLATSYRGDDAPSWVAKIRLLLLAVFPFPGGGPNVPGLPFICSRGPIVSSRA